MAGLIGGGGIDFIHRFAGDKLYPESHFRQVPSEKLMQLVLTHTPIALGLKLLRHFEHLLKIGTAQLLSRQFPLLSTNSGRHFVHNLPDESNYKH